jgi:hypothetical protein
MSVYTINSETAIDVVASNDVVLLHDTSASGIKKATVAELLGAVVNATAATLTVTAALHANKTITLNRAGGIAVTLPDATGTGNDLHLGRHDRGPGC